MDADRAAPIDTAAAGDGPYLRRAQELLAARGELFLAGPGRSVRLAGIAGPLTAALTQLATLAPGVKALIGFIGFVVALVSLAGLRNFGPVLFYLGLAIFAAVGLVIAGAIMGAVLPMA